MQCTECGATIDERFRSCQKCGKPWEEDPSFFRLPPLKTLPPALPDPVCAKCGAKNEKRYRYCGECGQLWEQNPPRSLPDPVCAKCGATIDERFRSCQK